MSIRNCHSAYLYDFHYSKNRKRIIEKTIQVLKDESFDTIAFTGMSGALYAPIVAYEMDKSLIAVRKSTKDCHSSSMCEGNLWSKQWIILDDFSSTGKTIQTIWKSYLSSAEALTIQPHYPLFVLTAGDNNLDSGLITLKYGSGDSIDVPVRELSQY